MYLYILKNVVDKQDPLPRVGQFLYVRVQVHRDLLLVRQSPKLWSKEAQHTRLNASTLAS